MTSQMSLLILLKQQVNTKRTQGSSLVFSRQTVQFLHRVVFGFNKRASCVCQPLQAF